MEQPKANPRPAIDPAFAGLDTPEYDALAELFLASEQQALGGNLKLVGGDAAPRHSEPTSGQPAPNEPTGPTAQPAVHHVEGLVLGHLPVLAAAWAGQYARSLAEGTRQPVALLRAHAGTLTLDLVASVGENAVHLDLTPQSAALSIDEAIRQASRHTSVWLLRVEELNEPDLTDCAGLTRLTLLTGADDAALVASYRTIKFLAQRASERHDAGHAEGHDASPASPPLRVVVMGAASDKAAEAETKLRKTARTFLGQEIEVLVGAQKIASARTALLYKGAPIETARLIELIRGAPLPGARAVTPPPASRIGPTAPSHTPPRIAPPPSSTPPEIVVTPAFRTPAPEPSRPDPPPASAQTGVEPDEIELAQHLAGFVTLPGRCPYANAIQLAADPEGTLHILARVEGPAADEAVVAETIARLVSVGGWAFDHMELLRLASPGVKLSGDTSKTALHLFTDQPRNVRRFLESGVHVHLLAAARVGNATAWVCHDLN